MLPCCGFRFFEESQHVSTEVNQESSEFKALMDYMCQTSGGSPPRVAKPGDIPEQFGQKRRNAFLGHRSHDTVTAIYRISREGEAERFKDTWTILDLFFQRKGRPALGLVLAFQSCGQIFNIVKCVHGKEISQKSIVIMLPNFVLSRLFLVRLETYPLTYSLEGARQPQNQCTDTLALLVRTWAIAACFGMALAVPTSSAFCPKVYV